MAVPDRCRGECVTRSRGRPPDAAALCAQPPADPTLRTADPTETPGPTTASVTATPVPADVVARRVARVATDERYQGLADIEGAYTDEQGPPSWDVELGTAGDRRVAVAAARSAGWRSADPGTGHPGDARVWERGERTDWERRARTDRDRPIAPLFDLADATQLSSLGITEVDGVPLYRFEWHAGDERIRRFIRELGAADGMTLASGELLATAQGVPVRLELSLVGDGSGAAVDPSLRLRVDYSEVGSDIEIRTPRIGPPLVVLP